MPFLEAIKHVIDRLHFKQTINNYILKVLYIEVMWKTDFTEIFTENLGYFAICCKYYFQIENTLGTITEYL
jgi:hypothetical protein